jgi:hypothetical protein
VQEQDAAISQKRMLALATKQTINSGNFELEQQTVNGENFELDDRQKA